MHLSEGFAIYDFAHIRRAKFAYIYLAVLRLDIFRSCLCRSKWRLTSPPPLFVSVPRVQKKREACPKVWGQPVSCESSLNHSLAPILTNYTEAQLLILKYIILCNAKLGSFFFRKLATANCLQTVTLSQTISFIPLIRHMRLPQYSPEQCWEGYF